MYSKKEISSKLRSISSTLFQFFIVLKLTQTNLMQVLAKSYLEKEDYHKASCEEDSDKDW